VSAREEALVAGLIASEAAGEPLGHSGASGHGDASGNPHEPFKAT
jgi:hypothetical protein